jgi:hypothetical protein
VLIDYEHVLIILAPRPIAKMTESRQQTLAMVLLAGDVAGALVAAGGRVHGAARGGSRRTEMGQSA